MVIDSWQFWKYNMRTCEEVRIMCQLLSYSAILCYHRSHARALPRELDYLTGAKTT